MAAGVVGSGRAIVKISERKKHLRRRGVVPVAQQEEDRVVKASTSVSARKSATYTAGSRQGARAAVKGGATRTPARAPRKMGARYQLTIGALYVTFAPLLLIFYIAQLRNPKVKTHPDVLQILLTVLFFLFGVWNVYRGLQARRRDAAAASGDAPPASSTAAPLKRPRALKGSSS